VRADTAGIHALSAIGHAPLAIGGGIGRRVIACRTAAADWRRMSSPPLTGGQPVSSRQSLELSHPPGGLRKRRMARPIFCFCFHRTTKDWLQTSSSAVARKTSQSSGYEFRTDFAKS
jgi:hypothetical protein